MKIRFLGTGTSGGVPEIACECATCRSADPRDRRLRPSILVEKEGTRVVVDTTPEFRLQMLEARVKRLDAVLFTHSHADHLFGLDDVRRFNILTQRPLPAFADSATAAFIRRTFAYIFEHDTLGIGLPSLELREIAGPFDIGSLSVVPVPLRHGPRTILGYRFGGFAYCTDANEIPDASRALLRGLDTLVLNALRHRPHRMHFTLEESLAEIAALAPRRAFIVHMNHDLKHAETEALLPPNVRLAYDGLEIEAG